MSLLAVAVALARARAGGRQFFHLNEAGLAALRDQLDTFWNRALSGFRDLADQPEEQP